MEGWRTGLPEWWRNGIKPQRRVGLPECCHQHSITPALPHPAAAASGSHQCFGRNVNTTGAKMQRPNKGGTPSPRARAARAGRRQVGGPSRQSHTRHRREAPPVFQWRSHLAMVLPGLFSYPLLLNAWPGFAGSAGCSATPPFSSTKRPMMEAMVGTPSKARLRLNIRLVSRSLDHPGLFRGAWSLSRHPFRRLPRACRFVQLQPGNGRPRVTRRPGPGRRHGFLFLNGITHPLQLLAHSGANKLGPVIVAEQPESPVDFREESLGHRHRNQLLALAPLIRHGCI